MILWNGSVEVLDNFSLGFCGRFLEVDGRQIFLHLCSFQSRVKNIKGMRLPEFCQCLGRHFNSSDLPVALKAVPLNVCQWVCLCFIGKRTGIPN